MLAAPARWRAGALPSQCCHSGRRCPAPPLQVCINLGILAAYCIGVAYEAGVDTVDLLGHPVEWW